MPENFLRPVIKVIINNLPHHRQITINIFQSFQPLPRRLWVPGRLDEDVGVVPPAVRAERPPRRRLRQGQPRPLHRAGQQVRRGRRRRQRGALAVRQRRPAIFREFAQSSQGRIAFRP